MHWTVSNLSGQMAVQYKDLGNGGVAFTPCCGPRPTSAASTLHATLAQFDRVMPLGKNELSACRKVVHFSESPAMVTRRRAGLEGVDDPRATELDAYLYRASPAKSAKTSSPLLTILQIPFLFRPSFDSFPIISTLARLSNLPRWPPSPSPPASTSPA